MSQEREKQSLENRSFLHDLATPLTVMRILTKRLRALKQESAKATDSGTDPAHEAELLRRLEESLEKVEALHAQFKAVLHERESKEAA